MDQTGTSTEVFERGAVPLGPFDMDPVDLFPHVCVRPDGSWCRRDEILARSAAWLVGALTAAGVSLGDHDREIAAVIAEYGWPTVQVVAGWVSRAAEARSGPPLTAPPEGSVARCTARNGRT